MVLLRRLHSDQRILAHIELRPVLIPGEPPSRASSWTLLFPRAAEPGRMRHVHPRILRAHLVPKVLRHFVALVDLEKGRRLFLLEGGHNELEGLP